MKKVCVYSGSNLGSREEYKECARMLGKNLSENGMELIYGGSNVGLMGEVAQEVLANGGKATGVIPTGLFPGQIINQDLTLLIEVKDMHERKKQWLIWQMLLLRCRVELELMRSCLKSSAGHSLVFIKNR